MLDTEDANGESTVPASESSKDPGQKKPLENNEERKEMHLF